MNESFLSKLLNYYGLDKDEYLRLKSDVKESDLPDRKNFFGAQEAKEDIEKAIAQGEKILIYGDYDCDGIMATSIMVSALTSLGGDVGYYIPIRSKDGYGLTKDNVDNFLSSGYKQLICVDNGITLFDEVAYAKEKGMKVTIIDHHTPSDELPKADHIIHRKYSSYAPFKHVGWSDLLHLFDRLIKQSRSLSQRLRSDLDDQRHDGVKMLQSRYRQIWIRVDRR
jgi:single-stranded DNA-specific DHH superfamily exonuclease